MMTKPMISFSHVWLARMVLVLCMTAAVSEADAGVPVLRDFEDLPVGAPVFNQYDGVTFLFGDTLNFDGTHPITIVQPLQATASPTRALSSYIQRTCEFCGSQLILRFDEPQSRVSLSTGLAQNISIGLTMLLEGFTADPTGPGAVLVAQNVAPCLGTIPTLLTTPLEITDDAARIRYARPRSPCHRHARIRARLVAGGAHT